MSTDRELTRSTHSCLLGSVVWTIMTMMDEYRHDVTFLHFFQISENAIYGTCVINTAIRDK